MGQGGYINIVNKTPHKWVRTHVHSYQMNAWDDAFPATLDAGQQKRCYIEFSQGITENAQDDAGEVNYSLEGTSRTFQLQVRGRPNFHLQVDWQNTPGDGFLVFPPPANSPSYIGWMHNGTLSLAIGYLKGQSSPATTSLGKWTDEWIELYSNVLNKLTVRDLTIPGTHDSGTYDMVTIIAKNWTQTQDLNLAKQLASGARSLDLRIGYQPDKSGDEKYILVHDTWPTEVTLVNALQQVLQFSKSHPQEIMVLDCHRFVNLGKGNYDYAALINLIKTQLGDRILPPSAETKNLKAIWENATQRIIVAFNTTETDPLFWPGVAQQWAGSDVTTANGLHQYIQQRFTQPLPSGLWSFQAAVAPLTGPPSLSPDIGNWFYAGTDWANRANIIAVDWIEKTALVPNAVCASFLKGID